MPVNCLGPEHTRALSVSLRSSQQRLKSTARLGELPSASRKLRPRLTCPARTASSTMSELRYDGRVAIVTGAGGGLGAA